MTCSFGSCRETIILILLLLCFGNKGISQNQHKADSLKAVLTRDSNLKPTDRMAIIANIAAHSASPDEVLVYARKLLAIATKYEKPSYIIDAYHYTGVAYRLKGNLKASLTNLFRSASLAANYKHYEREAEAYEEIANTYTAHNDLRNALRYNKIAIRIVREYGTEQHLAINLLNTGYNYYQLDELNSALLLYNEAEPIFERVDLPIGKAYTIGNRALVYWKQGNSKTGEKDLLRAIGQ